MVYLSADLQKPVQYCTSGKFLCEEGGAVHPARKLNTFVLLFGCEGEYRIWQNDVEYCLVPGSFLLLLADHPHRGTEPCGPGLSHYWCHFLLRDPYTLTQAPEAEQNPGEIPYDDQNTFRDSHLLLPEYGMVTRPEKCRLLFHGLMDCARTPGRYRSHQCDLMLSQLLYECADTPQQAAEQSSQTLVSRTLEYIRLHADEGKTVEQIAAHFDYNPEYLTTLVRRSTGKTMLQHLNAARLETAEKLLLETALSVAEIALLSGFEDPKYFARIFRRVTDMTPTQYRNTYSRLHINR